MNFWNNFAAKHPAAAKWVREGGLFVIVSNLITVFKYLLLQFLPKAFASLPVVDFGWPGIDITLFGETFKWNILGYDAAHGGLPYFCAYMVAMVIGECINFPIQRNLVFRSKGSLARQIDLKILTLYVYAGYTEFEIASALESKRITIHKRIERMTMFLKNF